MTKALVIYHANCDDGFGAALAFWKYSEFGYESVTYHPGVYGQSYPALDKDTDVYILDFSYSPEILVEMAEAAKWIKLLDHHKTAKEAWDKWLMDHDCPDNLNVEFDMERSGAMMALDYFGHDDEYNLLFDFLQDRDLWQFKLENTKYFTRYLRAQPMEFEVWDSIAKSLWDNELSGEIFKEGKVRLAEYESICKDIVAHGARPVYINGVRGLECNCPALFASDVGNILARESGNFGHTWQLLQGGSQHSLRSIGEVDVSAIAKELGGGGHKNAAGFRLALADDEAVVKFHDMFKRES